MTDAGVGVKVGELREEAMAHATEREYRRLERLMTEREAAAVAADVPMPDLAAHAGALDVSGRTLTRVLKWVRDNPLPPSLKRVDQCAVTLARS